MTRIPVLVLVLASAACGGGGGGGYGSSTPTSPSPTSTVGATIAIGASGVSPKQVRIEAGQLVQFVNDGALAVEIMSDPHPTHTACPPINDVGRLTTGQRRNTAAFTRQGTCSYHDNLNDSNTAMRGTILVGVSEPTPPPPYSRPE